MRWISVLGVLCFAVVPAFGHVVEYTFNLDPNYSRSYIEVTIQGEGSTDMDLAGSFCATINQSDGHIGSSDTFALGCATGSGANITNTTGGEIDVLGGFLTASVGAGDLRLVAFDANYPTGGIHIGEGGEFSHSSGAHIEASVTVVVYGLINTTITTAIASEVVAISGTISTSVYESDTILLNINALAADLPIEVTELATTFYLDLEVHLEGTAHMTPDPVLGGLIALGLGGAGTWLRRRRRV